MPGGEFMFQLAVEPFLEQAERVLFAVLREHDEQFQSKEIIQALIPGSEVLIIDEVTRGPAETVNVMLEQFNVEGSFLIKDTDSYFKTQGNYDPQSNYVSLCSAREIRDVKLYNKSFAVINDQGYIVGMVEKEIASEFFSCGGYYFAFAQIFMECFQRYERMQVGGEFFTAQVIDLMIGAGHVFLPMHCHAYEDWGTHEDWVAYRKRIAIYFFDLDGVIYENGSPFWKPKWGENPVIPEARDKVNQLYDQGN